MRQCVIIKAASCLSSRSTCLVHRLRRTTCLEFACARAWIHWKATWPSSTSDRHMPAWRHLRPSSSASSSCASSSSSNNNNNNRLQRLLLSLRRARLRIPTSPSQRRLTKYTFSRLQKHTVCVRVPYAILYRSLISTFAAYRVSFAFLQLLTRLMLYALEQTKEILEFELGEIGRRGGRWDGCWGQ